MRTSSRIVVLAMLAALVPALSACTNFDPDNLDIFKLNEKKKLPGERKELFPGGVPGVTQGIPSEYMKGNQPPETAQALQAPAPEQNTAAEEAEPQKKAAAADPEPKPKPKRTAKPRTASQQSTQAPSQQMAPWPQQSPQSAPQQAQSPWPAQEQSTTAPWPSSPQPGTFSR